MIKNVYWSSCIVPFILVWFLWNWDFLGRFSKNPQISNLMQIRPSGIAESEREGTRAETRIGLSVKRTSPFKSAGGSVQSTTGSRGVRISRQDYWLPTPFASFPFTSPPVRHCVLSHSDSALTELFHADSHDEAKWSLFTVLLTRVKFGFCIAAEISGPLHITVSQKLVCFLPLQTTRARHLCCIEMCGMGWVSNL